MYDSNDPEKNSIEIVNGEAYLAARDYSRQIILSRMDVKCAVSEKPHSVGAAKYNAVIFNKERKPEMTIILKAFPTHNHL